MVKGNEITDIFELKFVPHYNTPRNFHYTDIEKLKSYRNFKYTPAALDPYTGQWVEDPMSSISGCCQLHFVIIGREGAASLRPENICNQVWLWYGRISGNDLEWGICRGEKNC